MILNSGSCQHNLSSRSTTLKKLMNLIRLRVLKRVNLQMMCLRS